ncbi:MAG: hypothetical protein LBJ94_01765 [Puniceicoccales bacterium]|jgi:hypothetical protein|nr:hypothetical protein [Puniceicoccales bacterium]
MNLSKNKKRTVVWATIAMIAVVFFVLRKSISTWRVAPHLSKAISMPTSRATPDLLNFNDQKVAWDVEKQPDGQPPCFELFTPPNVYREGKQVVMEPCTHWRFDFVFPLQLKYILKKKYRLQLEGYIQTGAQSDTIVLIRDLEGEQTLRCSVGQSFKSLGFELLSFQLRTIEKNDMVTNIPVAKIKDTRDKLEAELTDDTKYYDNKYVAIVEDLDGQTYTLSDLQREVKIGESTCVLESLDAENNVISIVLVDANRQEFHKKLRILR